MGVPFNYDGKTPRAGSASIFEGSASISEAFADRSEGNALPIEGDVNLKRGLSGHFRAIPHPMLKDQNCHACSGNAQAASGRRSAMTICSSTAATTPTTHPTTFHHSQAMSLHSQQAITTASAMRAPQNIARAPTHFT